MHTAKALIVALLLSLLSSACQATSYIPIFGPSPTPTLTPTPTQTPTPTVTPTPTPTPTPLPASRVEAGDQALFNGDWDTAKAEYQAALAGAPDPQLKAAALLGLGRAHYQAGEYDQAESELLELIQSEPGAALKAQASLVLAEVYEAQERSPQAAQAYSDYLAARPGLIDSYVYERRGDALVEAGDYAEAVTDYQAAVQNPRAGDNLDVKVKAARAYALSGDYRTAIVGYQDIYNQTSNDYTKAQMDLLTGQAYTALGEMESAYTAYLDAALNFPRAYDSYNALIALVEAGVPVDEFQRGLVDYYAGEYSLALAAFDRYLQGAAADAAKGRYFRGLALDALGGYWDAVGDWDWVIQNASDSIYWDKAWEQKAYTLWYNLDLYGEAVKTLTDFVAEVPTHIRAAEFLFDAGGVSERAGELSQAARLWTRVAEEYPSSEQANRALFLAGITRYRQKQYPKAHDLFQRLLVVSSDPEERASAYLWSGKIQQDLGDAAAARSDWEQAASLDPTGYYSERARDLLQGNTPFTPPQEYDFSMDIPKEQAEAEAWMRTVFSLPPETDFSGLGSLKDDPRFQRGSELWQVGWYGEARAEFEALRQSIQDDPVATYRLANYLVGIGAYRSAVFAARQVLTLAGMDDAETMSAPVYFNHLRFGTYFRDLVIGAAKDYDFHPLFLFSLIRQESLFESFASSSASARGLMQIVPATGEELAADAGWPPNYTSADLYRPLVSLRLGCEYLNRQLNLMDGDFYGALAAYNGGPGNARLWKGLAPDDPDLFLEVIRFSETRLYIRRIYEIFSIYRSLYERAP